MTDIERRIHPDDLMWKSGPDWYFSVGESGLKAVKHAISASWLTNVSRVLDLPCGHGRVARFLRHGFPDAEMFFCDIDRSGAEFCADVFHGTAIISKPELSDVALPDRLDVIWVGSLFTHVDRDRTARWLAYLSRHLAPHGVLVATFHGAFSAANNERLPLIESRAFSKILNGYRTVGYGYAPYPGDDGYGVSLSTASAIMNIAAEIPGIRIVGYQERGWANNHDVLALTKNDRLTPF